MIISEGFTPEDWASNMLTVMLDSTETIGLVFKLVLFALARNPKEQEKLRTEVLKNGSKLEDYDYDKVATLKRMDMFINGTEIPCVKHSICHAYGFVKHDEQNRQSYTLGAVMLHVTQHNMLHAV